jgi:signal transduction histidine kinase
VEPAPESWKVGNGPATGEAGLSSIYHAALCVHFANPSTSSLRQAYALGKAAMDGGMGTSDVIRIHHRAIAVGALVPGSFASQSEAAPTFEAFLLEALAPFRLLEDNRAQQIKFLIEQNEALALRNVRLEAEVADREAAEFAMQDSKDRYFQLYQVARAKEANLRVLSAQVLSAQEEERKRMSRELHDDVGQALTAVNVAISMVKNRGISDASFRQYVTDAENLLERTMQTVHEFARELRPAMLDHLGLQSALRAHILLFNRQTGIMTELVPHPSLGRLDERKEEVLFRVAEEALSNISKHSRATLAKIEFSSTGLTLQMVVGDNGCAFDVGRQLKSEPAGRIGLLRMQERIRNVNGTLDIESAPGRGTSVRVQIPLADASSSNRRRWNDAAVPSKAYGQNPGGIP